jgi:predicted MFS family arabinose efflux permease
LKAKPDGEVARILLAFLATAGIFYINIMPAIGDGLKEGLAFSNKEAGLVASANTYGAALGAFLVVFFVKGINWRKASYTLLVILISVDLMCMYLTNANTMIAVRFMYGLCGGALVGIGFSVMSRTSEVSRTFGYLLTIQFGLGGVGIIYLPDLVPVFGTKALFLSLAAFGIVTMIMVPFLSDYPARQAANRKVAGLIPSVPAVLALIATRCRRLDSDRGFRTGDNHVDKTWAPETGFHRDTAHGHFHLGSALQSCQSGQLVLISFLAGKRSDRYYMGVHHFLPAQYVRRI